MRYFNCYFYKNYIFCVTFLLRSEVLTKANHSTIAKLFDNSMHLLWPEEVRYDDVLLFLSDAAPYMVKSGNQ
jgi:hypothetical protein